MIAILAYWPALWGPFVFDDHILPFSNPSAAKAGAAFWIGGVRPVLMATYWINFMISGTRPFSYHAGNLLLHTITAVIVFFLLRRLVDFAEVKVDRQEMALLGAGVFFLHPLQVESVAYIAGRSELVAGLFYFGAWLVFVNSAGSEIKFFTAIEIMLLAGAAVGGKESAITLPAILFLTDLYWNPASLTEQIRSRLKLYIPLVLGGLIVGSKILLNLTGGAGFAPEGVPPSIYALTQCRVILTYIRLFCLPLGQSSDWALPYFRSLTDHAAWIYVLGMLAFVAAIVLLYRRARLLSFGLLIFLVLLLPTSSIVPINDAIAERRVYVPIIGLILASIWAIDHFGSRIQILREARTLRVATFLILGLAAVLSFERSHVWSSGVLFWEDAASKNPSNRRAHIALGSAYGQNGRCADAIREFKIVARQAGINDELSKRTAAAYECNNQPDLALKELYRTVASHPTAATYAWIGYLEGVIGRSKAAMTALNESIRLDPLYATAYAYRGQLQSTLGDQPKATADLQRALEIDPGNTEARDGMAKLVERRR